MNTFANRSLPVQLSLAKLFTFRWQFTFLQPIQKICYSQYLNVCITADRE